MRSFFIERNPFDKIGLGRIRIQSNRNIRRSRSLTMFRDAFRHIDKLINKLIIYRQLRAQWNAHSRPTVSIQDTSQAERVTNVH